MEDIEEEVVFKGSALYAHLSSLQLTEEEEDDHPLLPSLQTATPGNSPHGVVQSSDAQQAQQKKHSLYQKLHHWSWGHIECLFDNIFETHKSDQHLLWRLAMLLCRLGILTQDDRLHLYYFSPVFSQLVEEPSLGTNDPQSASIRCRPATLGQGLVLGAALAATAAACCGGWVALNLPGAGAPGSWVWGSAICCVLLPALAATATIGCRMWHARRYERCFSGMERVLSSLAALQHTSLPHAFGAAADAGLLTGPHDSDTASTPLIRRVRQELLQLQQLLHSTLQCVVRLVGGPSSVGPLEMEGQVNTWPATKAARRQLETLVSAYARDILLQAERAFNKDSSTINLSPRVPLSAFSPSNVSSVHSVITEAYAPLLEQLPQLESYSSVIASQVKLLKHCWLYSGEETRPREVQTEEQAAADTLTRHLQTGLRQLDQARVALLTLSDSSIKLESYKTEQLPVKNTISKCGDVDGDNVTAFEDTYGTVCSQLKELRATVDLCLNDVTVLEESVAWRRLRLLQQLGRMDTGSQGPATHTPLYPDDEMTLSAANGGTVELVPYIAEDEVFEGSTERADGEGEDREQISSVDWLAEAEEDQQRKKLRACGRRLLAELQPILDTKKKEFQEREKRAWKRMKGSDEGDETCLDVEARLSNNEVSVAGSRHDESQISRAESSTPSTDEDETIRSLSIVEIIPSTVNKAGDTVSTLANTRCDISNNIINNDAINQRSSLNDDKTGESGGKEINVNLVGETNGVVYEPYSRTEALCREPVTSVVQEAVVSNQNSEIDNNSQPDKFWYFFHPDATVMDVFGVGKTHSADCLLLLPLFRVPRTALPRLKQSALTSRSDQTDSKLAQLETCDTANKRLNGLSMQDISSIVSSSVALDAPPVIDFEDCSIAKFLSENNLLLPLIKDEENAEHQTEQMRHSFLNGCDGACFKTIQLLTRRWTVLCHDSKKSHTQSNDSLFDDASDDQSNGLKAISNESETESNNPKDNTQDLSPMSSSEGEEKELQRPTAAPRGRFIAPVHAVRLPLLASQEYTSNSGDSGDDDDDTVPSTLSEDKPTVLPVAQEFTSDPSTDGTTQGESSWNLEEKPIDLQGRLKMLLQTHMQERGVEDGEDVEDRGLDREGGVSLGFHSQLARQAVQMSSKFGIGCGREEMFGGVGQNEAVFGDSSSSEEEESDDTDSGEQGERWAQTEI